MSEVSSDADSGIESLRDSSNFFLWKTMVTLHLRRLGFWEITSGAAPRPTAPEPPDPTSTTSLAVSQKAWDRTSATTKLFLFLRVGPNIQEWIVAYDTAPKMWKALMNRFNRCSAVSHIRCLLATGDPEKYSSAYSIVDHLNAFERNWGQLVMRTADAEPGTDSVGHSLKPIAMSSEAKAAFLIMSLPESLRGVIENLRIIHDGELEYHDVHHRLLDVHDARERQRKSDEAAKAKEMDCTWCRSRGLESGGHTWKRCYRLRQFKKKKAEHDRATSF